MDRLRRLLYASNPFTVHQNHGFIGFIGFIGLNSSIGSFTKFPLLLSSVFSSVHCSPFTIHRFTLCALRLCLRF